MTGVQTCALPISAQIAQFAGNGLELLGSGERPIFAISARAAASLREDQRSLIERFAQVVPISIPTIERSGGSVRCTLAGIHLAPRVDQSR